MAKVYLIGGTPRTGKLTLAIRFIEKRPIRMTSADAVRHMLRDIIRSNDQPELFRFAKYITNDPDRRNSITTDHQLAIAIQTKESEIVWRSIMSFMQSNIEEGYDVLIEGLAIMPAFIKQLNCDFKAVFLGNQSKKHQETILNYARHNSKDWMHALNDKTIMEFAALNQTYSLFIEQEANRNQLPYVEIHDDLFDADMQRALSILLA